jgi:glutamyl-tRNA synthetase
MRNSSDRELLAAIDGLLPHIADGAEIARKLTPAMREKLVAAMPNLKERAKTLVELVDAAGFLWADRPLQPDEKAQALLTPEGRDLIRALVPKLEAIGRWDAAATEAEVRAFVDARDGLKLGGVAQPLRAALTGRTTSPPIFDVLAVLGKDESLARLRDQAG